MLFSSQKIKKWALPMTLVASGLLLSGCQQSNNVKALGAFPPSDYNALSYQQKTESTETYINNFYSIASPTKAEREDYHKAMTALSQLKNVQYKPNQISTNSPDCQYIDLSVYPPIGYNALSQEQQIKKTKYFINQFYRIEKPTQLQYKQYQVAVANLSKIYNPQYVGSLALTESGQYSYINLVVYPPKNYPALSMVEKITVSKKYINQFYELQAPTKNQIKIYHEAIHNLSELYNKQY